MADLNLPRSDWRLRRLHELIANDPDVVPGPEQRAIVLPNDLLGWRVVRAGVPDINARESWHLRRKRAQQVAAAWNEALDAT